MRWLSYLFILRFIQKKQRKNIYFQNHYGKERTFYTLWDFFLLFVPLFWDLIFTQCPMDGQSSLENEYCIYLS